MSYKTTDLLTLTVTPPQFNTFFVWGDIILLFNNGHALDLALDTKMGSTIERANPEDTYSIAP